MVFPEQRDSSPPFPPSTLSSSASFSLSASGSLKTHLSSFNSEHRLRSLPSAAEDLEKHAEPDPDNSDEEADGYNKQTVDNRRFSWLVKALVWFSTLFFPISVFRDSGFLSRRPSVNPPGGDYEPGHLRPLWENERLLSKITTLDLRPSRFRYYAPDDPHGSRDLTACAWLNLADFDDNWAWLQKWPGPISLVLSVDRPYDLDAAQSSLQRLIGAPSNDTLPNQGTSYLIYLKDSAGEQPNAYLNLARLVSQTQHTVLFPEIPLGLHPAITHDYFYNATRLRSTNTLAVLTASRKDSVFPFSSFSPLMVHRGDTTWCDERFDFLGSRCVAWEECLWQFWIMKHGRIQSIVSKHPWKTVPKESRTTAVFEERLREHFRDEICLLAVRNTLALIQSLGDHEVPSNHQRQQEPVPGKYVTQRRWLKKHCRQLKVKGLQ